MAAPDYDTTSIFICEAYAIANGISIGDTIKISGCDTIFIVDGYSDDEIKISSRALPLKQRPENPVNNKPYYRKQQHRKNRW